MASPYISVVSPVYKGEKMVHELVSRIVNNISPITNNFEIVLVNDASPDNSWEIILKECKEDKRVKGINLSRNFGQHRAITAGLNYAKGEWVVVMDCDLQDRPEEIPKLFHKAEEGWDIVLGRRVERKDNFLKRLSSTLFYVVFRSLSGIRVDKTVANFGIYRHTVIDAVLKMEERDRDFAMLVNYVGFKSVSIPIEHGSRFEGKSSYSISKLLDLSFAIIVSNTNRPLRYMVTIGFLLSLFSIIIALYNVVAYFSGWIDVPGFTSTIFSIWFVGGMLMMQLGIVGVYIGKVFNQVKGRPLYFIMDKVNLDDAL